MKLRQAVGAADKVFVQASNCGTPIRFRLHQVEVYRVVETYYLESDLNDENVWSDDEGLNPFWEGNDLILSYT